MEISKTIKMIELKPNHLCFESIRNLSIQMQAFSIGIEYVLTGTIQRVPGQVYGIDGKIVKADLTLPIFGPIESLIKNQNIKCIQVRIKTQTASDFVPSHDVSSNPVVATITNILTPIFVTFYEQFFIEAQNKFGGKNYDSWPSSWRMGWVVRNALSHNGCVYFKSSNVPPIKWREAEISPLTHQGMRLLHNIFSGGDLLFLMFDMEMDLTGNSEFEW
jgi:hypothetical protein